MLLFEGHLKGQTVKENELTPVIQKVIGHDDSLGEECKSRAGNKVVSFDSITTRMRRL